MGCNEKLWDGNSYKTRSVAQNSLAHNLLASYPFTGKEKTLDLGCGNGSITASIAKKVNQGSVNGARSI